MRLLMPTEVLARYPEGGSVAFIGNAPSLRGEALGKWIESHDVVVRFNECPISGFESDVGTRTHILVTNPYPEKRGTIALERKGFVVIISPQTRRQPSMELASWIGEHDVIFTYSPDLVQVGDIEHKASLTTGVYGIHLLARLLRPTKLSITGFTMFLQDTTQHYWCDNVPKGLTAHDVVAEAKLFIRICNSWKCSVEVSEEVAWVARRIGVPLHKRTLIRKLSNEKWKT